MSDAIRALIQAVERLPSQGLLNAMLAYDPDTGDLHWRHRGPEQFQAIGRRTPEHMSNQWNSRFAGKPAMNRLDAEGYRKGWVCGLPCRAHRVIWKMAHGTEPEAIDHINGDRADNRLCNLRSASRQMNSMNVKTHRDNKSGVLGVHFDARYGKWIASGKLNGRTQHLGTFSTIEDAAAARKAWQEANGFHPNHGRALKALEAQAEISKPPVHLGNQPAGDSQ